MYDTVHLWLPMETLNFDFDSSIQVLSNLTEHVKDNGQLYYSGHLSNIKVNLSEQGVSLKGSLAKYLLHDNFKTLTRSDTKTAIEKLSDELFLPIGKAKVTRLDFGQNFITKHTPESYYHLLGDCKRYNRFQQAKSLYYQTNTRQLVFYNKIAEAKSKGQPCPKILENQNLLRYEVRFMSKIMQQLKQNEISASTLFDEPFYITIFERWFNEYDSIKKYHNINIDLSTMKTPKDYMDYLLLWAVQNKGHETIMKELEMIKQTKSFEKPEYHSRLKKQLQKLLKPSEMTFKSELIEELDKKLKAAKNHFR